MTSEEIKARIAQDEKDMKAAAQMVAADIANRKAELAKAGK